jgi:purine-binding chemotaxis protein CheW
MPQAAQEQAAPPGQQYLTFVVGGESFATTIASVKEIIEYRKPTDVPMMPGFMRGVINLRGHVVPVIDPSVRFGRAPLEATRRSCIVILDVQQDGEAHDIGVMVDAVSAVREIADADIEPAPTFGAKLRADFIRGMGKIGEKFVIILELERVLSMDELITLTAITGEEVGDPAARAGAAAPPEA